MPTDFSFDVSPSNPTELTGAFGFSADQGQSAVIADSLNRAKGVVGLLQSHANQQIVTGIASAAATADQLTQPVVKQIQGTLGNAVETLGALQSPIEQSIVTQISQIGGNVVGLGVNLPSGQHPVDMPLCVLIRNEAEHGSLQTAFGIAANMIHGTHGIQTSDYFQTRNFLEECLTGFPELQTQLNSQIGAIEQQERLSLPTKPIQPLGTEPLSQVFGGVQPQTNLPLTPVMQTQPVTPGEVMAGQVLGAASSVTKPASTGGMLHWPTCNDIAGLTIDQVTQKLGAPEVGHQFQTALGLPEGYIWSPICGSDGKYHSIFISYIGVPPVPQAIMCPITPEGVCGASPSPITQTPTIAPPATPSPPTATPVSPTQPCPPQKECQPVKVVVECGKTCGTGQPTPETPSNSFCIWQNVETNVCYALPEGVSPTRSSDRKLICGKLNQQFIDQALQSCSNCQQQTPPTQQTPGVAAAAFQGGCADFPPTPIIQPFNGMVDLLVYLGLMNANGTTKLPFPNAGELDIFQNAANAIIGVINEILNSGLTALGQVLSGNPCGSGPQMGMLLADSVMAFVEKYIGTDLTQMRLPNQYQRQFQCPVRLPTIAEAASAYMGNQIDAGTLQCWVQANNGRWPEMATYIDSLRSKLSPQQMAFALRRGLIDNPTYATYVRESGYIRNIEPNLIFKLTEFVAPPTDIVRMMIRDAADTVNINWQTSDQIFVDKYSGILKTWGEWQGIDPEYMKMLWRSHWSLPAPGQLYEMLHRLSRLPPNDPAFVNLQLIRQTLLQQDIHPDWVDKFVAISYAPLTRIDARRAYEIGALTEQGLKEAYLNLGYSDQTSDTLVEFNRRNVQRTFLRNPAIRKYATGELTLSELSDTLQQFGARPDAIDIAIQYGKRISGSERRKRCIASIRKRFMLGEFTFADTVAALQSQGLDADQVNDIAGGMQCERDARGKVLSGSAIMSLYKDGIINEGDAFNRLLRIGYVEDDASLVIRQTAYRINLKIQADQLKALKQQQADAYKLQRAIQRQEQQAASAAAKAASQAERARKLKELREKRLLEAASLVSQHTGTSYGDAVLWVRNLHNVVSTQTAATIDESIQAIGVAASDKQLTTLPAIQAAVAESVVALV